MLDLTILPATQSTISITACDSYTAGNGNTYFQDTSFSYTLLSAQGCDSIINLNLTINQTSIPNTLDVTTCNTYTAPWGTSYSSSGEYSDTTSNTGGCDSISVIRLTINRDPSVTLSVSSPDSCAGRAVSFSLSNEAQISGASWNFGDPESGPDNFSTELNPMHIYSRPGTFRLQCIFQLSCGSDTLSSVLRFYDCSRQADICDLYIPTAFSPNGDGANDLFRTGSNCPFEDYFLQIFNRWGERIFLSDKPQDIWAGTYQQNPCPLGVYIYTLRYRFQSGEVQYARGNVTLVR